MFVTIINDCKDENARGRQESRVASLMGVTPSFVGVQSDIEASMQMIDILDATEGRKGLLLVNVAPRGGHTVKWENGTPFAYVWHQETLIISTVDGFAFSGLKKFLNTNEVTLLDTHSAAAVMKAAHFVAPDAADRIPTTQFRSFDFTPRVGAFLLTENQLPGEPYSLENVPDLPAAVWHIDNFGNCKTTLTNEDVGDATELETKFGTLPLYTQLRNVPDASVGATIGSSGLRQTRCLELVMQNQSFAAHHNVTVGDSIIDDRSYLKKATDA